MGYLTFFAVWFLISIPFSLFIGKFCALQNKAPVRNEDSE